MILAPELFSARGAVRCCSMAEWICPAAEVDEVSSAT
ncbi:Uncharacterised protein [Mycobacteroides abscessus subsp. massiliense]|nr:Uncharacterised protein [Mycobacteroides abscessus subsp. massiliense]